MDISTGTVWLLAIGLMLLFALFLSDNMSDKLTDIIHGSSELNETSSVALSVLEKTNNTMQTTVDYAVLLLAAGFIIFSYIMARVLPVSNAFYGITILVFILIWGIAFIGEGIYEKIVTASPQITVFVSGLTYLPFIMSHLFYYALLYSFIVGVGLYAKE